MGGKTVLAEKEGDTWPRMMIRQSIVKIKELQLGFFAFYLSYFAPVLLF